jgi:2-keto-4-pentenoate hydratase/2-oxohepta-3-ene-1,7-dioic acid hydratase in catechol pathway
MKFMRVGPVGQERQVLGTPDGRWFDLTGITANLDGSFLSSGGLDRAANVASHGTLPAIDIEGLRRGAPISRPGVVVCIGLNYAAHAAEAGSQRPERPIMFYKAPNTVVGPDDDIIQPRGSTRLDWEIELAVVIGRRARYLADVDEARRCIAGYCISNDVSERDFQLDHSGGQWSKGKSCETFNPLGPWLVTPDEIDNPQSLAMRTRVNGEIRQDSSTKDMIFGVLELVRHLSQYCVLEPGDLINTGTPEGVAVSGRFPYLRPGDLVELEIDGLGIQRQRVAPPQL